MAICHGRVGSGDSCATRRAPGNHHHDGGRGSGDGVIAIADVHPFFLSCTLKGLYVLIEAPAGARGVDAEVLLTLGQHVLAHGLR